MIDVDPGHLWGRSGNGAHILVLCHVFLSRIITDPSGC